MALLKFVILGLCWGYLRFILGLYWGYFGIMENEMETTIVYTPENSHALYDLGFRAQGLGLYPRTLSL